MPRERERERDERLYGALRAQALRVARHLVGRDDAEDLAHEAVLALLIYCRRNKPRSQLRTLITIVRRRAADHWRKPRHELAAELDLHALADDSDSRPSEDYPALDLKHVLRLARGPRQRAILIALARGQDLASTAADLGIPIKRARRIVRAMTRRIARIE